MSGSDPRPLLQRSFDQAASIMGGVSPDQLAGPTPCTEFDVAALLGHLTGVGNRVAAIGRGEPQTGALPVRPSASQDVLTADFVAARDETWAGWASDEILERKIELPFGTFTGAMVAQIYTMELTTHSWDLASATGQIGRLDDELAIACLPIAQRVLPPDYRGGRIPFAAVVPVAEDAPAYDRLAGFMGRAVG